MNAGVKPRWLYTLHVPCNLCQDQDVDGQGLKSTALKTKAKANKSGFKANAKD